MVEGEKSMPSELNPTKPDRDFVELGTPRRGGDDVGVCISPPRRTGRGRLSPFSLVRGRNGSGEDVAGGVAGCRWNLRCVKLMALALALSSILLLLVVARGCGMADAAL